MNTKLNLTAALILGLAALPATAMAGDSEFFSQLGGIQDLVFRQNDAAKVRFRKTTHETGPNDPLLLQQKDRIAMIAKVKPSIVFLIAEMPAEGEDAAPGAKPGKKGQAICTGFFIDASKYTAKRTIIATNSHCVEKTAIGAEIGVGLYQGNDNSPKMTKGRVLAYGSAENAKDIAFVELVDQSLNRPPLPLWSKVDDGEDVIAIGNPRGLLWSVSKGIISAVGRDHLSSQMVLDLNQSDAAVNPGNSGGPLFNLWGDVIGINEAIESQSGGFEGLAFSVPANYVIEGMKQYGRTGNLKIGALQIEFGPDKDSKKLVIGKVVAGGPADLAQVKDKDQIQKIDGIDVNAMGPEEAMKAFMAHVKYMSPGEKAKIVVLRDGKELTIEVTLGEPKAPEAPRPEWAPIPKKPKPGASPTSFSI